MNTAQKFLTAWLAMLASPAIADMGCPPPEYDVGANWMTEAEILVAYTDRVPANQHATFHNVHVEEAFEFCNWVHWQSYGRPYPEETGKVLACYIPFGENGPTIVYSHDDWRPELATQLLRHEIGHQLGWPGDHAGSRECQ